jgi:hypothetical protein
MFRYVVWAEKTDEAPVKLGTYRTILAAEEAVAEVEDDLDYDGCEFTLVDSETNDEWMYTTDGWKRVF